MLASCYFTTHSDSTQIHFPHRAPDPSCSADSLPYSDTDTQKSPEIDITVSSIRKFCVPLILASTFNCHCHRQSEESLYSTFDSQRTMASSALAGPPHPQTCFVSLLVSLVLRPASGDRRIDCGALCSEARSSEQCGGSATYSVVRWSRLRTRALELLPGSGGGASRFSVFFG